MRQLELFKSPGQLALEALRPYFGGIYDTIIAVHRFRERHGGTFVAACQGLLACIEADLDERSAWLRDAA